MSDRPVPPLEALVEAICTWCGEAIYGCRDNWHLVDGSDLCVIDGCFHEPEEELLAEDCLHLDDCVLVDGEVLCGECGELLGDLEY